MLCFFVLTSQAVHLQEHAVDIPPTNTTSRVPPTRFIDPAADQPATQAKSQGAVLYCRQFWALFVKRAISAKRDRLAVVLQLLVPILLVLLALRAGNASTSMVQEPSLPISRYRKVDPYQLYTVMQLRLTVLSSLSWLLVPALVWNSPVLANCAGPGLEQP